MISQSEYLEYLKGIASKISDSGIEQDYRGVALQLMARPKYYMDQENQGKKAETNNVLPLTEIAKLYGLTIQGSDLLMPKGGLQGDDYKACSDMLKSHGYKYGGKGSYKFVKGAR
jgi:hypothetical protein